MNNLPNLIFPEKTTEQSLSDRIASDQLDAIIKNSLDLYDGHTRQGKEVLESYLLTFKQSLMSQRNEIRVLKANISHLVKQF